MVEVQVPHSAAFGPCGTRALVTAGLGVLGVQASQWTSANTALARGSKGCLLLLPTWPPDTILSGVLVCLIAVWKRGSLPLHSVFADGYWTIVFSDGYWTIIFSVVVGWSRVVIV